MDDTKPFTLISSPRTGSTVTYFIVRWYLIKRFGYCDVHLGEYFNPYHYNLLYRDVFVNGEKSYKENIPTGMQEEVIKNNPGFELVSSTTFKAMPHKEIFSNLGGNTIKKAYDYNNLKRVDEQAETLHRINLLLGDSGGKYFFKNHADPLPENAFNYLVGHYNFICVDRLNKLDQYLSFAVANHTRVWMLRRTATKPIIEPGSILYTRQMFDQITERICNYYKRIATIPEQNKISIWYEDIEVLDNKFELLNLLGFSDWRDYLNPEDYDDKIPAKQSDGNNISFIKNKEEFLDWFAEISDYFVDFNKQTF